MHRTHMRQLGHSDEMTCLAENLWTLTLASGTRLVWAGCLGRAPHTRWCVESLLQPTVTFSPSCRSCLRSLVTSSRDSACPGQRAATRPESTHQGKHQTDTRPAHRIWCRRPPRLGSVVAAPRPDPLAVACCLCHSDPIAGTLTGEVLFLDAHRSRTRFQATHGSRACFGALSGQLPSGCSGVSRRTDACPRLDRLCTLSRTGGVSLAKGYARTPGHGFRLRCVQPVSIAW